VGKVSSSTKGEEVKFKLRKVISETTVEIYGATLKREILECGHLKRPLEIDSRMDALAKAFGARRRCFECGKEK
jgi:hypothetical protein